jgi:hypothetical protein
MERKMSPERAEASRATLATTVARVLRQHGRDSAHPADQAALRRAAAAIARALQTDFVVVSRHSPTAELTERQQLSEHGHE